MRGCPTPADACGDAGLQVAGLAADTQRALRDLPGRQALVAGPHRDVPVIALAVAGGLDWARDICQRVQQTVTWRV